MNEPIEFDYLLSEETLRTAESVSRQGDMRVELQYGVGVMGGVMVLLSLRAMWARDFGLQTIAALTFGCLAVLWFPPLSRRWMKRVIAGLPQVGKRVWVKVTEDEVSYSVEDSPVRTMPWTSIKRAVTSESSSRLRAMKSSWLPYEFLESSERKERLVEMVGRRVRRTRKVS